MRINDALELFPEINPVGFFFYLANRTAWKGEITGGLTLSPGSRATLTAEGVGTKSVGKVMEAVVCGGIFFFFRHKSPL